MNFIRRLPPFEYLAPKTVDEALTLLKRHKGKAMVLAGGTDLLIRMKERKVAPEYLVGLKNIPGMDGIEMEKDGKGFWVGALATHQTLAGSPLIKEKFSCLAEACRKIASPQIRSIATIGGNICNCGPSADSAAALIALGARVKLLTPRLESYVPVENFFRGPFQPRLHQGELLTAVWLPLPLPRTAGCYKYLTKRTEIDETLVGAAVSLTLDKEGRCREVGIGLISVGPVPFRAEKAEKLLKGRKLDARLIEEAAAAAAAATSPRSRADYRREMTAVMVTRALNECYEKLQIA